MAWSSSRPRRRQNSGPDQSCVESRFFTICDMMYQLEQQEAYEHPQMTIIDGYRLFPQNQTITLNIEGGKFTGHFANSDTFIIVSREHPDYELNPPSVCGPVDDRYYTVTAVLGSVGLGADGIGSAWYDATVYKGSSGGTDIDPERSTTSATRSSRRKPAGHQTAAPPHRRRNSTTW